MWRCLALTICANLKLAKSALYFASLLKALNPNCRAYSILKCSSLGKLRIKPTPHSLSFEDSLTYRSCIKVADHAFGALQATELETKDFLSSSLNVNSDMKFATACPLMTAFTRCQISY